MSDVFQMALNWAPMLSRDASLSHSCTHIVVFCAVWNAVIRYRIPDPSLSWRTLHRTANATALRRAAVRGTGVFRHHGAQLRASLEPSDCHRTIVSSCSKGALHLSPIMPRCSSLSDSRGAISSCHSSDYFPDIYIFILPTYALELKIMFD